MLSAQAAFRGHQVRKQYCKIIWSVGVLEKAILRWRLKRRGLRGIHTEAPSEAMRVDTEPANTEEEEFFRISREQAEERVKRSVIRVQTMFRSYRAQQEYRRMRMAHEKAKVHVIKEVLNTKGMFECLNILFSIFFLCMQGPWMMSMVRCLPYTTYIAF